MTTQTPTPLRRRMLDDMKLRNMAVSPPPPSHGGS